MMKTWGVDGAFCNERFFVVELVVKDFFSLRFWVEKAELSGSGDRQTSWVWLLLVFFFFFPLSLSSVRQWSQNRSGFFFFFFWRSLARILQLRFLLVLWLLAAFPSHGSSLWHPLAVSQSFFFVVDSVRWLLLWID